MAKPTGFLEEERKLPEKRPVNQRIQDYNEIEVTKDEKVCHQQATRCMDCGIPFCHQGCPLGNIIPEFNDAVYQANWQLAYEILISTNNFPEFTGRICPAPCEASCVLGINKPPVAIEFIEKNIIEKAFESGFVKPRLPFSRTGKKIAVVGSGPAGLAAAAQLNYAGHYVHIYEKSDEAGGLLRYGIPDFKLEKSVLNRRISLLKEEGIIFHTSVEVGLHMSSRDLLREFDTVLLCGGSSVPRALAIPGANLKGVHFAMDFLTQQNRRVSGKLIAENEILASGKHVVVIGGGDTGSDCVGTSIRQKAKSITQVEILPKPPLIKNESTPWPNWPTILRTSTSHEEGCQREWSIITKEFIGNSQNELEALRIANIEWYNDAGKQKYREVEGTERTMACELALLALGFIHPQHHGLINDLGIQLDDRGNVKCENFQTSVQGVFAAGDMHRGQSLVVWAISEGREAARAIDEYLMGSSKLESKEVGKLSLTV